MVYLHPTKGSRFASLSNFPTIRLTFQTAVVTLPPESYLQLRPLDSARPGIVEVNSQMNYGAEFQDVFAAATGRVLGRRLVKSPDSTDATHGTVLGAGFIEHNYVLFDRANHRFGLAQRGSCGNDDALTALASACARRSEHAGADACAQCVGPVDDGRRENGYCVFCPSTATCQPYEVHSLQLPCEDAQGWMSPLVDSAPYQCPPVAPLPTVPESLTGSSHDLIAHVQLPASGFDPPTGGSCTLPGVAVGCATQGFASIGGLWQYQSSGAVLSQISWVQAGQSSSRLIYLSPGSPAAQRTDIATILPASFPSGWYMLGSERQATQVGIDPPPNTCVIAGFQCNQCRLPAQEMWTACNGHQSSIQFRSKALSDASPTTEDALPICQSLYTSIILWLQGNGQVSSGPTDCMPSTQQVITNFVSTCANVPVWRHTNGDTEKVTGNAALATLFETGVPRSDGTSLSGLRGCHWRSASTVDLGLPSSSFLFVDNIDHSCGGPTNASGWFYSGGLFQKAGDSSLQPVTWIRESPSRVGPSGIVRPNLRFEASTSTGGYWQLWSDSIECDLRVIGLMPGNSNGGCYTKQPDVLANSMATWRNSRATEHDVADSSMIFSTQCSDGKLMWLIGPAQANGYTGTQAHFVLRDAPCIAGSSDNSPAGLTGAAAVASFFCGRFDWNFPVQRLFLSQNIEAQRPRPGWSSAPFSSPHPVPALRVIAPGPRATSPWTVNSHTPPSGLWSVMCPSSKYLDVSGTCDQNVNQGSPLEIQPGAHNGRPFWVGSSGGGGAGSSVVLYWHDCGKGPMWILAERSEPKLNCDIVDALYVSALHDLDGELPVPFGRQFSSGWLELTCSATTAYTPRVSDTLQIQVGTGSFFGEVAARTLVPIGVYAVDSSDPMLKPVACSAADLMAGAAATNQACCDVQEAFAGLGCSGVTPSTSIGYRPPSTCSPACAAVFPAFFRACGHVLREAGGSEPANMALEILLRACEAAEHTAGPGPTPEPIPGPIPEPEPGECQQGVLQELCGGARRASVGNCFVCAGQHQARLKQTGCEEGDIDVYCRA
jgi:hypothetical protein